VGSQRGDYTKGNRETGAGWAAIRKIEWKREGGPFNLREKGLLDFSVVNERKQ